MGSLRALQLGISMLSLNTGQPRILSPSVLPAVGHILIRATNAQPLRSLGHFILVPKQRSGCADADIQFGALQLEEGTETCCSWTRRNVIKREAEPEPSLPRKRAQNIFIPSLGSFCSWCSRQHFKGYEKVLQRWYNL